MNSSTQKLYNNYINSAGKEIQVYVNYLKPPRYYIYDKSNILRQDITLTDLEKFLKDNNYVLLINNTENKFLIHKIKNDLSKHEITDIDTSTGGRKSHRRRKSHKRRKSHRRRK